MSVQSSSQKIGKTIKIYLVAQIPLIVMLVFMAIQFQARFQTIGRPDRFMHSVIASFLCQIVLLYPIYRFSAIEVERDLKIASGNLTSEEVKFFSKKKRWSDIVKISVFSFFGMFFLVAPGSPKASGPLLFLAIAYFSFVLTILSYLQCYNFAAKRQLR